MVKKPRLNVLMLYLVRIAGFLIFGLTSYFVIGALREDNDLLPVVAIVMLIVGSMLYLLKEYSRKDETAGID